MNLNFFNKTFTLENLPDISQIDVSFVNESDILSAAENGVTGDTVLMLLSELNNAKAEFVKQQSSDLNRIQPFYSKLNEGGIVVSSHAAFFGYKKAQNQTFSMQQMASRQAKFVYLNYLTLLNRLNNMISHAPNANVKNDITNLKQEAILSMAVLKNIISLISNNSNPVLNASAQSANNMSFCNELKSAIKTSDIIISGLIRLNRMINIPQISNQIVVLTLSVVNMHHKLKDMLSYC